MGAFRVVVAEVGATEVMAATGAVDSIEHHPMRTLHDAGVPDTLGSDDPPMFNVTLVDEYRRVRDAFQLGRADLLRLVRTSIHASFADDHLKAGWYRELDGFADGLIPQR